MMDAGTRKRLRHTVSGLVSHSESMNLTSCLDNHVNYWKGKMANNEHWRFEMGFLQGWNDGKLFMSFPGGTSRSEIGYTMEWTRRRVAEHTAVKGGGEFLWEFGA